MKTREQYLNKECTHSEYYAQFVNKSVKERVESRIGKAAILTSTNEHFNDIPLAKWDNIYSMHSLHFEMANKLKEVGDYPTLAGLVCITKEAARQIKAENNSK
jgi:hypothetical protein